MKEEYGQSQARERVVPLARSKTEDDKNAKVEEDDDGYH